MRFFSRSFAWLLHADGPPARARHSTSFTAHGNVRQFSGLSFALQAHQETTWMIHNRAPLASSKQICIKIEAPLNSRTLCKVRDGKWATTHDSTLLSPEVHPYFRHDRLLCLTITFSSSAEKHFRLQNNKKYIPILREVLLTHEYRDSKDVLQLPEGPKQG